MKIRMHKGSLAEALKTVEDIQSSAASVAEYLSRSGLPGFDGLTSAITVSPYGHDARTAWDTHIVTLAGLGVVAFTDGPLHRTE